MAGEVKQEIVLDLRVNTANAINDFKGASAQMGDIFTKEMEQIDSATQQIQHRIEDIKSTDIDFINKRVGASDSFDTAGYLKSGISQLNNALSQISTTISGISSSFQEMNKLPALFRSLYQETASAVQGGVDAINGVNFKQKDSSKRDAITFDSRTQMNSKVRRGTANAMAASDALRSMVDSLFDAGGSYVGNKTTGLNQAQLNAIVGGIQGKLKGRIANFKITSGKELNLEQLVGLSISDKLLRESVNSSARRMTGKALSQTQLRQIMKLSIMSGGPSTYKASKDYYSLAGLERYDAPKNFKDRIPLSISPITIRNGKQSRQINNAQTMAYMKHGSTGYLAGLSEQQIAKRGNLLYKPQKKQKDGGLAYIYELIKKEEGAGALTDAAEQAGLIQRRRGRVRFGNASQLQLDYFAGLVGRKQNQLVSSFGPNYLDVRDPQAAQRSAKKHNKNIENLLLAQKMLASFTDAVMPDADLTKQQRDKYIKFKAANYKGFNIATAGTPQAFLIPQTVLKNGKLEYRDPSKISKANTGSRFSSKASDEWVTFSQSIYASMFGLTSDHGDNAQKGNKTLNGTYGFGRDKNGKPIQQDTPTFLKIAASDSVLGQDSKRKIYIKNDADYAKLVGYANGQTAKYGPQGKQSDYHFLYSDGSHMFMVRDDLYQAKQQEMNKRGLSTIFKGLSPDMFDSPYKKDVAKGIDISKKGATPSVSYRQQFGFDKDPRTALIDFQNLYTRAGIAQNGQIKFQDGSVWDERMDGNAFIRSNLLPYNAQMRDSIVEKYVANKLDFDKLFSIKSSSTGKSIIDTLYESGKFTGEIIKNNDNESIGYSLFVPMLGLDKRGVQDEQGYKKLLKQRGLDDNAISQAFANATRREQILEMLHSSSVSQEQKSKIRQQQMYDLFGDYGMFLVNSSNKSTGQFAQASKEDYKGILEWMARDLYGQKASDAKVAQFVQQRMDAAEARGLNKNGFYSLLRDEQESYLKNARQATGGLRVARTSHDSRYRKQFLSAQLVTAMGMPQQLRKISEQNYEQELSRLTTKAGIDDFLEHNQYAKAMLQYDPEYAGSNGAQKLIQNQIKMLQQKRKQGIFFFKHGGPEGRLAGSKPGQAAKPWLRIAGAQQQYKDNPLFSDQDAFIPIGFKQEYLNASRDPAAAGQYLVNLKNLYGDKKVKDMMRAVGADLQTAYFTPHQMYQMNTGDFDGDVAWVFNELSTGNMVNNLSSVMQNIKDNVDAATRKLNLQHLDTYGDQKPEKAKALGSFGQNVMQYMQDYMNQLSDMGLAEKVLRSGMRNMQQGDQAWLAIAQGARMYDQATAELKGGSRVHLGAYAQAAVNQGDIIQRFMRQLNGYTNSDNKQQHTTPDIFNASMPSVSDVDTFSGLVNAFAMRRNGQNINDDLADQIESMVSNNYGLTSNRGIAASMYGKLISNLMTGKSTYSKNDIEDIRKVAASWSTSLNMRSSILDDKSATRQQLDAFQEQKKQLHQLMTNLNRAQNGRFMKQNLVSQLEQTKAALEQSQTEGDADRSAILSAQIDSIQRILHVGKYAYTDQEQAVAEQVDKVANDISQERQKQLDKYRSELRTAAQGKQLPQQIIKRISRRNLRDKVRTNWSDVTPWLHDLTSKAGISIDGMTSINRMTGQQYAQKPYAFDPFPYHSANKNSQKALIQQKQLMGSNGQQTVYMNAGTQRHKAMQEYLKSYMSGQVDKTIQQIYADILTSTTSGSQAEKIAKNYGGNGVTVTRDEQGALTWSGNSSVIAKMQKALGTWDANQKRYKGGTLQAFLEKTIMPLLNGGGYVAAMEGVNYDENGNTYGQQKEGQLEIGDLSGRGTNIHFGQVKDSAGNNKRGTFAADLVIADKDGNFHMMDYKSDKDGSLDSIVQMMVYAKDYEMLAKGMTGDPQQTLQQMAKLKARAQKKGFGRFVDDQGKLKFTQLHGLDMQTGTQTILDLNNDGGRKLVDDIYQLYQQAIINKMDDAVSGKYQLGLQRIRARLDQQYYTAKSGQYDKHYGYTQQGLQKRGNEISQNSQYAAMLSQKFAQDEQTMKNARSFMFKKNVAYGIQQPHPWDQWQSQIDSVKNTLNEDQIAYITAKSQGNEPLAKRLAQAKANRLSLLQQLQAGQVTAATQQLDLFQSNVNQQLYGKNKTSGFDSIKSMQTGLANAAATMESLKQNYFKDGQWSQYGKKLGAPQQYQAAQKKMADIQSQIDQQIPNILRRDTNTDTRTKNALLGENVSPQQKILQSFQKRQQDIYSFVKQKQQQIKAIQEQISKQNSNLTAVQKAALGERVSDIQGLIGQMVNQDGSVNQDYISNVNRQQYDKMVGDAIDRANGVGTQSFLSKETLGAFSSLGQLSTLQGVGQNVSAGLAQGIAENTQQVQQSSEGLVQAVVQTVQGGLQINSPSVVMKNDGTYVVQGLVQGIMGSLGLAQNAASELAKAIIENFQKQNPGKKIESVTKQQFDAIASLPDTIKDVNDEDISTINNTIDSTIKNERDSHLSSYLSNLKEADALKSRNGGILTDRALSVYAGIQQLQQIPNGERTSEQRKQLALLKGEQRTYLKSLSKQDRGAYRELMPQYYGLKQDIASHLGLSDDEASAGKWYYDNAYRAALQDENGIQQKRDSLDVSKGQLDTLKTQKTYSDKMLAAYDKYKAASQRRNDYTVGHRGVSPQKAVQTADKQIAGHKSQIARLQSQKNAISYKIAQANSKGRVEDVNKFSAQQQSISRQIDQRNRQIQRIYGNTATAREITNQLKQAKLQFDSTKRYAGQTEKDDKGIPRSIFANADVQSIKRQDIEASLATTESELEKKQSQVDAKKQQINKIQQNAEQARASVAGKADSSFVYGAYNESNQGNKIEAPDISVGKIQAQTVATQQQEKVQQPQQQPQPQQQVQSQQQPQPQQQEPKETPAKQTSPLQRATADKISQLGSFITKDITRYSGNPQQIGKQVSSYYNTLRGLSDQSVRKNILQAANKNGINTDNLTEQQNQQYQSMVDQQLQVAQQQRQQLTNRYKRSRTQSLRQLVSQGNGHGRSSFKAGYSNLETLSGKFETQRGNLKEDLRNNVITQQQYNQRLEQLNAAQYGQGYSVDQNGRIVLGSGGMYGEGGLLSKIDQRQLYNRQYANYNMRMNALRINPLLSRSPIGRIQMAQMGMVQSAMGAKMGLLNERSSLQAQIDALTSMKESDAARSSQIQKQLQKLGENGDPEKRSKLERQRAQIAARSTNRDNSISKLMQLKDSNTTQLSNAQSQIKKLNGPLGTVAAIGMNAATSIMRAFGLSFQQIISQAKKFVEQFDNSMTQIQMVTLKSDEQIQKIGDSLIQTAKKMKVSIKDVTTMATSLYRQGLSDSQVGSRLQTAIMLQKTTGLKGEDAVKLLTVAANNGGVGSQRAADVVTALGDSAATNAKQLTKGLQKTLPAANALGISYQDLTALLTIATSSTQLGGNVAGTMLNSVFGRWNKASQDSITYDEQGNRINANDIYKSLKMAGINMYNEDGSKKGVVDVLQELAGAWQGLDDATKSYITSSIAGTRQYSNFAAILSGMSQVDPLTGKTLFQTYRQKANTSEGTTSQKYGVYQKSLASSSTALANSFGDVLQSLNLDDAAATLLDIFTQLVDGLKPLAQIIGGIVSGASTLIDSFVHVVDGIAGQGATGGILTSIIAAMIGGPIGALVTAVPFALSKVFPSLFGGESNNLFDGYSKNKGQLYAQQSQTYANSKTTLDAIANKLANKQALTQQDLDAGVAAMKELQTLGVDVYNAQRAFSSLTVGVNANEQAIQSTTEALKGLSQQAEKQGQAAAQNSLRASIDNITAQDAAQTTSYVSSDKFNNVFGNMSSYVTGKRLYGDQLVEFAKNLTSEDVKSSINLGMSTVPLQFLDYLYQSNGNALTYVGQDGKTHKLDIKGKPSTAFAKIAGNQQWAMDMFSFQRYKSQNPFGQTELNHEYVFGFDTGKIDTDKNGANKQYFEWVRNKQIEFISDYIANAANEAVNNPDYFTTQNGYDAEGFRKVLQPAFALVGVNDENIAAVASDIIDETNSRWAADKSRNIDDILRQVINQKYYKDSTTGQVFDVQKANQFGKTIAQDAVQQRTFFQIASMAYSTAQGDKVDYSSQFRSLYKDLNGKSSDDVLSYFQNKGYGNLPIQSMLASNAQLAKSAELLFNDDGTIRQGVSQGDIDSFVNQIRNLGGSVNPGFVSKTTTRRNAASALGALREGTSWQDLGGNDLVRKVELQNAVIAVAGTQLAQSLADGTATFEQVQDLIYLKVDQFVNGVSRTSQQWKLLGDKIGSSGLFGISQQQLALIRSDATASSLYDLAITSNDASVRSAALGQLNTRIGNNALGIQETNVSAMDTVLSLLGVSGHEGILKLTSGQFKDNSLMQDSSFMQLLNLGLSAVGMQGYYDQIVTGDYSKSEQMGSDIGQAYIDALFNQMYSQKDRVAAAGKQLATAFSSAYADVQLSGMASAISGSISYQKAQHAYNNYVSGSGNRQNNLAQIASYLGVDQDVVSQMFKTGNGNVVQEALKQKGSTVGKSIKQAIKQSLDIDLGASLDKQSIIAQLQQSTNPLKDLYIALIQSYGNIFTDAEGNLVAQAQTQGAGLIDVISQQVSDVMKGQGQNKYWLAIYDAMSSGQSFNDPQSLLNYFSGDNSLGQGYDWKSFTQKHPQLVNMFALMGSPMFGMSPSDVIGYAGLNAYGNQSTMAALSPFYSSFFGTGRWMYDNPGQNATSQASFFNPQLQRYNEWSSTQGGEWLFSQMNQLDGFSGYQQALGDYNNALNSGSQQQQEEALQRLTVAYEKLCNDGISKAVAQQYKFNRTASQGASALKALQSGGSDMTNQFKKTNGQLTDLNQQLYYASGKGKNKQFDSYAAGKLNMSQNYVSKNRDAVRQQLMTDWETQMGDFYDVVDQSYGQVLQDKIQSAVSSATDKGAVVADLPEITFEGTDTVDLQGLYAFLQKYNVEVDQAMKQQLQYLVSQGLAFHFQSTMDQNGNGSIVLKVDQNKSTDNFKTGGGGKSKKTGGGSGKSAIDALLEKLQAAQSEYDNVLKILDTRASTYEVQGKYTMQKKVLQQQLDLISKYLPKLKQMQQTLRNQLKTVQLGSEDWKKLQQQLNKVVQASEQAKKKMAELEKQIKQIEQTIRQTTLTVQNTIEEQIKARIQMESDMLAGTVSMQDTVLQAIKQRYQDEWDLIKKDIAKKKQALQEQIGLIDQRLQKRKSAEDQAKKYEQLAQYQKQLALVEMDSTRTKQAAELRKKISDLQSEIGWDIAQQQAQAEKKLLQNQLDAYDEFEREGDQDLQDLLSDANNFATEVSSVMALSHDQLMTWLSSNVKDFANSLQATQKQMLEGWQNTYKQMMGITDTWWPEIAGIMSSKKSFVDYMKQSETYKNASATGKQSLVYQWQKMFDDMVNANLDQSTTDTYYTQITNFIHSFWATFTSIMNAAFGSASDSSGSGSGKNNSTKTYSETNKPTPADTSQFDPKHKAVMEGTNSSGKTAQRTGASQNSKGQAVTAAQIALQNAGYNKNMHVISAYKAGGQADYTGPAWLDGTKKRPQRILSQYQTQLFDNMVRNLQQLARSSFSLDDYNGILSDFRSTLAAMQNVSIPNFASRVDMQKYGVGGTTIGDLYITLNEAQFNNDSDYDMIAQKVGESFSKMLTRNGIHTTAYML